MLDGLDPRGRRGDRPRGHRVGRARSTRSRPRRPTWAGTCGSRPTGPLRGRASSWSTTPTASWSTPASCAADDCGGHLDGGHPWVARAAAASGWPSAWAGRRVASATTSTGADPAHARRHPVVTADGAGRPTAEPTAHDPPRRHGRVLRVGRAARQPELRGRPVIVGGAGDRGVVAAASLRGAGASACTRRCRRCGPGGCARTPCSCRATTHRYGEVSARVMAIFRVVHARWSSRSRSTRRSST